MRMGRILDGVADHMKDYAEARTFLPTDEREATREEIVLALEQSGAEVLLFANWVLKKKRNIFWFLKEDTLAEILEGGCDDGADEVVDPEVASARAAVSKFFGGAVDGNNDDPDGPGSNGLPGEEVA